MANLMNLLRTAALLAAEQQQECIELELLAQAFATRLARHLAGKTNPFTTPDGRFVPPQPVPNPPALRGGATSRPGRRRNPTVAMGGVQ